MRRSDEIGAQVRAMVAEAQKTTAYSEDGPAPWRGAGIRMAPKVLAKARRRLGLTHVQLAELLGVREDTVRRWQTGREVIPYRINAELIEAARKIQTEAGSVADDLEAMVL